MKPRMSVTYPAIGSAFSSAPRPIRDFARSAITIVKRFASLPASVGAFGALSTKFSGRPPRSSRVAVAAFSFDPPVGDVDS